MCICVDLFSNLHNNQKRYNFLPACCHHPPPHMLFFFYVFFVVVVKWTKESSAIHWYMNFLFMILTSLLIWKDNSVFSRIHSKWLDWHYFPSWKFSFVWWVAPTRCAFPMYQSPQGCVENHVVISRFWEFCPSCKFNYSVCSCPYPACTLLFISSVATLYWL